MKKHTTALVATLAGAFLFLSGSSAFADGRDHDRGRDWERSHYDNRDWGHDRHHHHYDRGPAVVYATPYYAPPPPPVIYQPAYYGGYRPAPAVTIGIGLPPIVIPFR